MASDGAAPGVRVYSKCDLVHEAIIAECSRWLASACSAAVAARLASPHSRWTTTYRLTPTYRMTMSDNPTTVQKPVLFVAGKGYSLESMSPEARAQFHSLQYAENEVKRLEAQVAVAKTAAAAYRSALLAQLPK